MFERIVSPKVMKDIMEARQEGLSYSQIAEQLKLPYGTVKDVFHETRKKEGYHLICLEVPEEISEEEALKRITSSSNEDFVAKLWAELEQIYIDELHKRDQK